MFHVKLLGIKPAVDAPEASSVPLGAPRGQPGSSWEIPEELLRQAQAAAAAAAAAREEAPEEREEEKNDGFGQDERGSGRQ